jgi:hypothetical protein
MLSRPSKEIPQVPFTGNGEFGSSTPEDEKALDKVNHQKKKRESNLINLTEFPRQFDTQTLSNESTTIALALVPGKVRLSTSALDGGGSLTAKMNWRLLDSLTA